MPMQDRLARIHGAVVKALEEFQPAAVAIEEVFFARNVRSAVLMAHGRGAAILAAARPGITLHEYSALEIKQSVVGKGRATKEQVQQMVTVILGLAQAPSVDHETDALAAALCHVFRSGSAVLQARGTGAVTARPPSAGEDPRKALLALSMQRRRRR